MKKIFPRISTRGFYDLYSGRTIKNESYHLYPKRYFDALIGSKEITIMIHGLRNNASGALAKFVIAKRRLAHLGYKSPVIGYSYDSNTISVLYMMRLHTGITIANKNGRNLARFVIDFKRKSPGTKIRLMGHSLGAHVIQSTIKNLAKNTKNSGILEAVYFFGGSIPSDALNPKNGSATQKIVATKIRNYYSPYDDVLSLVDDWNLVRSWVDIPIGYRGARGKTISKYSQIMLKPKNHRFVSYAAVLRSFP